MAYEKRECIDNQTVITAEFINCIQDAICELFRRVGEENIPVGVYVPTVQQTGADTVSITFSRQDAPTSETVTESITLPAGPQGNGIKSAILNADYTLTLTFDNGTYYTTPSIRGAKGDKGNPGDTPKKGVDYNDGVSPTVAVSKNGKATTITITDANGTQTVDIMDGEDGQPGERGTNILRVTTAPSAYTTATGGFTPAYRIALSTVLSQSKASEVRVGDTILRNYYTYPVGYVDASYVYVGAYASIRGSAGAAGKGIESVGRTSGDGSPGTTDTYTITYTDDTTSTFTVYNGKDGESAASYTVPDYWTTAVNEAVAKVKALQDAGGHDVVNFVWFSDVHYGGSKAHVGNIGNISAAVMDECDIPLALMCGDTLTAGANNIATEEVLLTRLEEAMDEIYAPIGFDRLMLISGNHEDAYGKYTATDGTVVHYTNKADPKKIWNKLYRPQSADFRRVFGGDGTYFWVDNVPQKVRFVCLNSSYYDGAPNPNGTTKAMTIGFGAEQLAWLENTALNVDDGWSVAVCVHVPPIASYAGHFSGNDYTEIRRIITAAADRIIAVFTGHMHRDNIVTGDLPCPVVTVICAINTPYDGTEAERVAGTDKETALDVVSIDKASKTIYMTRIGAGTDRVVGYGGTAVVTRTITSNLTNCTNSNSATSIADGSAYTATISPKSGYELSTMTVTMGGTNITATAVNGGSISIANVTGDIIITATATEIQVATNLYDKSQVTLNQRYSLSSSAFTANDGTFTTGWIELPGNPYTDEIYLYTKGLNLVSNTYGFLITAKGTDTTSDVDKGLKYSQLNDTSGAYSMLGEVLDASTYYYKVRVGYNADGTAKTALSQHTHLCLTYQVGTTAITAADLPDFIMSFEPIE